MDCITASVIEAVCSTVDIFFTDFFYLSMETGALNSMESSLGILNESRDEFSPII